MLLLDLHLQLIQTSPRPFRTQASCLGLGSSVNSILVLPDHTAGTWDPAPALAIPAHPQSRKAMKSVLCSFLSLRINET